MTDNEIKLINMIRDHTHPDDAMVTAIDIICWYLVQRESFVKPIVAGFQESA